MNNYKISITKTYTIDVLAETQDQATREAETKLDAYMLDGTEHYYQTADTCFDVFDVTNTDDPFNP